MSRQDGFLWHFPGITSLVVPYFDTNDFYFSGHVATSSLLMFEYYASGYKKLFLITFCVMVFEWIMLMFLRTHYFIDLITGLIVAKYLHRFGEYLSFLFDVKLLRVPHAKRMSYYYKPCPKCGVSKPRASNYVDKTELKNQHLIRDIDTGKVVRVET
mmetsp:Transcript_1077/g.718  ORF Transcript_1077/g.718 Transcript_1077/m.718 type:complete len:157 (+) Transcript_1077:594-1064(+)